MLFLPLVIRDSYKIMIRILHTADWHLGQTFFGYDRMEEHEVFLNWLAEEIRQKEIDALIIAGDVFDVSNPSAASQSMYYQFIYRVTAENPYLQIVIVAGNHDSAARLEAPLPLLQAMRTEVRGVVRKLEGGEIDYDHLTVELKTGKGKWNCFAWQFLFCVREIIRPCKRKAIRMRREFANFMHNFYKGYGSEGRRIRRFLPSVICRLQDRRLQRRIIASVP